MRVVAALSLLIVAAAPPQAAFTVGALRRDGIVIPFATWDGKHWSDRWPAPARDPDVPINLISVPARWWGAAGARDAWQVWTGEGAPHDVRVTQPDIVDVQCVRQIGLRTDYRAVEPPPPLSEQPYPKDGLAVSPPHALAPIATIGRAAAEILPLGPVLGAAFNKAERDTAGRYSFTFEQKLRERADPEIEAAYAYGADPRYYYVESARTYRHLGEGDCGIGFGTGWFVRTGEQFKAVAMTVDLLPCSRYGATYMYPFGVMTLAGRTYWLAQFSGWDHERFVVVEVKPKAVEAVVNAWGGGC